MSPPQKNGIPVYPMQCEHADCTLPQGGTCAVASELADPERECPWLVREENGTASAETEAQKESRTAASTAPTDLLDNGQSHQTSERKSTAAPWRGRHLDRAEAETLLWSSPARLLAIVGPHGAGKTSLLASFFLQIANGQSNELPYRFAASRSFYALQELLERIKAWDEAIATGIDADTEETNEREIVGHTPKNEGPDRYLHLGLCPKNASDRRYIDVLLSDVAGEWFSEYTLRAEGETKTRMAFMNRCDGFIVVADACKLLGPDGRQLDAELARMIRRICDLTHDKAGRHRALALVLSKFDQVADKISPPHAALRNERERWGLLGKRCKRIWNALNAAQESNIACQIFPVSAFPGPPSHGQPIGVTAPFTFLMEQADRRTKWPRVTVPVPENASSLAAMRHWRDNDGETP